MQFHLLKSICRRRLWNSLWNCEQMKFHLAVNEVALPNLSALELTLLCYIVCSSWCYWLLIRSVYTFSFSLDFHKPTLLGIQSWFITENNVTALSWHFTVNQQWWVNIASTTLHKVENTRSHQLSGLSFFSPPLQLFFLAAKTGLDL